jgi:hypothetical protein
VTIADNSADEKGGGLIVKNSEPEIINSVLWYNSPEEIYLTAGDVQVNWSNISGGHEGEGNIDEFPGFMNTGEIPYALTDVSPCINAGIPDTSGLGLPDIDIAGNQRIYGGRIDMGAYENQHVMVGVEEFNMQAAGCKLEVWPNPVGSRLRARYQISDIRCQMADLFLILEIFNCRGEKVGIIDNGYKKYGDYLVEWDAGGLEPGVYYIRMQVNGEVLTRKVVKI